MNTNESRFDRGIPMGAALLGVTAILGCSANVSPEPAGRAEPQGLFGSSEAPEEQSPPTCAPKTRFYAPPPEPAAGAQIDELFEHHQRRAAFDLLAMTEQAHAVWFTSGTPDDVEAGVRQTVREARHDRSVPVLVAYDVPYRDCAQYSAGGAIDGAAYDAWIDGFADGIGPHPAIVILEPDSLGIIPYNTTIFGAADWCKPTLTDALGNVTPATGASPADRYAQLGYALVSLANKAPNARVYVDGTHSDWLGVGEAAYRIQHLTTVASQAAQAAGVPFDAGAVGFYLNVSNYRPTDQLTQFGTWVSSCIAAATRGAAWAVGHFDYCPSQYDPALGYALDYDPTYEATVTASLQNMLGGAVATTHFVLDTSRNGQGKLNTAPYSVAPYSQPANVIGALVAGNWCNPPGAGAGLRPTAVTGTALLDAYLWVKVPGQSDGPCDIAGGARGWDYSLYNPWGISGDAQNHFDPLWGMVDPAAGAWFPAQALQLARDASPPLAL